MAQPTTTNTNPPNDDNKNQYDGSKLFYPTYCYAKTAKLDFIPKDNFNPANYTTTTHSNEFDYYMTVGLNSNIKKDEFKRKHLNLIILLDISGSMGSRFYGDNIQKTKMKVANEAVVSLLAHLTDNDRFGLTTFESKAKIVQKLELIQNININNLKQKILKIRETGGTDFEKGYSAATKQLEAYSEGNLKDNKLYDNRIIMLTDAQPNIGVINTQSLLYVVAKNANDKRQMDQLLNSIRQADCYSSSDDDNMYLGMTMNDSDDDDDDDDCDLKDDDNTIGLAVGGAKDVNQYRKFLNNNQMPTISSLTYNGLLYEYYFNTKKRKSNSINNDDNKTEMIDNNNNNNDEIAPIYTTFIGVGLDFNTRLVDKISNTVGCNYFAVKSSKEFMDKMDNEEFQYMVTPLVFNVCLTLKCEGNVCEIDKVYGSNAKKQKDILENGEIKRINTLFPSKKSNKKGGTKGGIQLIKLKKINNSNNNNNNNNDNINVEIEVKYQDRYGKSYKNTQFITFQSPNLKVKKINNDMIDDDNDDNDNDNQLNNCNDCNFYDNIGIRKGILLCNYVELIHSWISVIGSGSLRINDEYKQRFTKFLKHFKAEMIKCKDNELEKEMKIIQKLVSL